MGTAPQARTAPARDFGVSGGRERSKNRLQSRWGSGNIAPDPFISKTPSPKMAGLGGGDSIDPRSSQRIQPGMGRRPS